MNRILLSVTIIFLLFSPIYSPGQVKEYFISCNPDDFNYIYANYWEDIYIPVTISYNNATWTDTKMRIRGDGSRQFPKKSLKVKFDSIPFINGRYELNFNAEWEDKSYMRAFVSSRVFKNAGQRCFGTDFARLYLNGEFLGLYCYVENVDEQFLEANNYDPEGNLYKAAVDGACLSIYDDIEAFWAKETGGGNKADLDDFINHINTISDADYLEFCQETMDYNQMVNIIACNMVLSNQSTYYHNYFMFHDINGTGKWEMMPWDLDKTLSVYAWKNYTNSSAPWVPDNPFLERALLNNSIFSDIQTRVQEITSEVFIPSKIWPMMDSLVTLLLPSILQDTTDDIASEQEWLDQVNIEKNYISGWPSQLHWQFNHLPSTFSAQRTQGIHEPDVTFSWTPSVDPDGNPVYYQFLITTGNLFEPELTTIYDSITATEFSLNDLPEDDYFWKVTTQKGNQVIEAFDSKNPLQVSILEPLPCTISTDLDLFSNASPYLVNCNVTVEPQVILTIHEGVTLLFENHTRLEVTGGLVVNGTENDPVFFEPLHDDGAIDSIVFPSPAFDIQLKYLNLTDGVIHANNANISFNNCELVLKNKSVVGQNVIYGHYYGNVIFEKSRITGNNTGQGMEFAWCQSAIVENCSFSNIDDPVEFISINSGYVQGNSIRFSNDDGIDFNNCKNLLVKNNIIYNCSDNGISIGNEFNGPCENISIKKNLIVNCSIGTTIKDGSTAIIDGNTYYHNGTTLKLWEKNAGIGGAQATVKNTIISSPVNHVFDIDSLSQIQVSYSLCDTENLQGVNNIFDDPDFVSVADSNFQLLVGSPCINSGDPDSPNDPDGTIADLGAFYYNYGNYNVIFNEINYKSATAFDTEDWVELYNGGGTEADISGWIFRDEDDNHIYEIPYGTVIQPEGYIILSSDLLLFKEQHPDIENVIGSFPFGLSSFGELIRLYNHTGILVDSLVYGVDNPWPVEPNGQGPTLELKNPFHDNALPENWCSSANHGSPGEKNSCFENSIEEPNFPENTVSIYPNPAINYIYFQLSDHSKKIETIEIFDQQGRQVLIMDKVNNNFIDLRENFLNEGIYFMSIVTQERVRFTGKFIIL